MNYGSLIFLGVFLSFALSWTGLILIPQIQLGKQDVVKIEETGQLYPSDRSGLAKEGKEIYRSLGCAECHSQQVRQSGVTFDVRLNEMGTNQPAVFAALQKIKGAEDAQKISGEITGLVLKYTSLSEADKVVKQLNEAGAKAERVLVPTGSDIARGWGKRHSVAQDYLREQPVLIGNQRVGPDLMNVGERTQMNRTWHLLHLYNPRILVKNSSMPPYRFLFGKQKPGSAKSANALVIPKEFAPEDGSDIVPTKRAEALVAYLESLRSDAPLFEAPMPAPSKANQSVPPAENNSGNAAQTNSSPK